MSKKKPDTFEIENALETNSENTGYSATGTQMAIDMMSNFVQKSELTTIKELVSQQCKVLEVSINDIKTSLSSRENRFWIINGIIIAALISIFLFALPYVYNKNFDDKIEKIVKSVGNVNANIDMICEKLKIKRK